MYFKTKNCEYRSFEPIRESTKLGDSPNFIRNNTSLSKPYWVEINIKTNKAAMLRILFLSIDRGIPLTLKWPKTLNWFYIKFIQNYLCNSGEFLENLEEVLMLVKKIKKNNNNFYAILTLIKWKYRNIYQHWFYINIAYNFFSSVATDIFIKKLKNKTSYDKIFWILLKRKKIFYVHE